MDEAAAFAYHQSLMMGTGHPQGTAMSVQQRANHKHQAAHNANGPSSGSASMGGVRSSPMHSQNPQNAQFNPAAVEMPSQSAMTGKRSWNDVGDTESVVRAAGSVAVTAETLLLSPRKLFICIIHQNISFGSKYPMKQL